MLFAPYVYRPVLVPGTPILEHAYYFVGLQSGFVLTLQSGETLGYTLRIN